MRTVGLQIKMQGNSATLAELDRVKKALQDIGKEMQAINKGKIAPTTGGSTSGASRPSGGSTAGRSSGSGGQMTEAQIKKEIQALQAQGQQYQHLINQAAQLRARQSEVTDAIRQQTQEFKNQQFAAGSYKAMNAELNKLRDTYRNLSEADRKGTVGQGIAKRVKELDFELKNLDKGMGQYYRNVGNYESALRGLGSALGAGFLIGGSAALFSGIVSGVKEAIQVTSDFNRQITFLGAVSRASSEELAMLEAQAKKLGETTQFSSSQVAQLQIEYAKLGFTPAQILAATTDTLNAAIVAQTDLGETAAVVGSVIRQFGFDAAEAGRVSDVMALAFSSSALDMQKFSTSMKTAGPIAASLGYSLEKTAAMLGTLANSGLDATMMGAGLKNMLLDLEVKGLSLSEALDMISNATDPAVKAFQLFGKRGAVIGTVLAQNREKMNELSVSLIEGAGFATEAAEKISSDLKGSQLALASALEATQLAFVGLYEDALQRGIEAITGIVRGMNVFLGLLKELPKFISDNRELITALAIGVLTLNANSILAAASALRLAAAQKIQAVAANAATVAQRALNLAMKANPIGLVVTAVALLVGLLVKLYRTNEDVRKGIDSLVKKFMDLYESNILIKIALANIIEPIKLLVKVFREGPAKAFADFRHDFLVTIEKIKGGFNELILQAQIAGQKIRKYMSLGLADVSGDIAKLEAALVKNREDTSRKIVGIAKDTQAKIAVIDEKAAEKSAEVERRRADQAKKTAKQKFDFAKLSLEELRELAASDDDLLSRQAKKELETREKAAKSAEKIAQERLKAAQKIAELETKLIVNEFDRRERELKNRASADISGLGGNAEQRKQQAALIQQILRRDLDALNEERRKANEAALRMTQEYGQKLVAAQVAAGKSEVDALVETSRRMQEARSKQADIAQAQALLNLEKEFAAGRIGLDEFEFEQARLQEKYNAAKLERERAAGEERIMLRMAQVEQEITVSQAAYDTQLAAIQQFQQDQQAALLAQLDAGNLDQNAYFQGVMALDDLIAQQRLDAEAEFLRKRDELTREAAGEALEFQLEMMEKEKTAQEQKNKAILEFEKQRREVQEGFEAALGESIGNFLLSQEKDLVGFMKSVTLAALDALERTINIAIAEATARALASADSVATFGVSGLAKAALIGGLIKGAFAAVKGVIGRLEEGGTVGDGAVWQGSAVPSEGGLITGGQRHSQGGIRGTVGGAPVEIEQGEYYLRNGAFSHVINRSSARRFLPALNALQRSIPPSVTSPRRAALAMRINRMEAGGSLAVRPLAAPVSPSRVLAAAGAESALGTPQQLEAMTAMLMQMIAATNSRIDRIQVVNDPAETLVYGERELRVRNAKAQ